MVHFNVSLGSAEETSAGYHRKVLEILMEAYAAEEERLRAARSQKKIPPAPVPSDKIPTAIGEPPMYPLISAAIPQHAGVERKAPSPQMRTALNPYISSSRDPTQQYYDDKQPVRNVPIYTTTALGNAVVGSMKVPAGPREDPSANFPFRRHERAAATGTGIRASPAFLEGKSEDEIAAFLKTRRENIECERRQPSARFQNAGQASRFLASKFPIRASEDTGPAPEPEPEPKSVALEKQQPRNRKRKAAAPTTESEPEPETKPDSTASTPDEKEQSEQKKPAKRQKTTARTRKPSKRASTRAPKAAAKPQEKDPALPADEDLEAF